MIDWNSFLMVAMYVMYVAVVLTAAFWVLRKINYKYNTKEDVAEFIHQANMQKAAFEMRKIEDARRYDRRKALLERQYALARANDTAKVDRMTNAATRLTNETIEKINSAIMEDAEKLLGMAQEMMKDL